MQVSQGINTVFAGGKDNQIFIGGQGYRRKRPLGQIGGVIGQKVAFEGGVAVAGVNDFDPVAEVAVLVCQGDIITGHKLGDAQNRG